MSTSSDTRKARSASARHSGQPRRSAPNFQRAKAGGPGRESLEGRWTSHGVADRGPSRGIDRRRGLSRTITIRLQGRAGHCAEVAIDTLNKRHDIGLVLSNIVMPGMSGLELAASSANTILKFPRPRRPATAATSDGSTLASRIRRTAENVRRDARRNSQAWLSERMPTGNAATIPLVVEIRNSLH